MVIPIRPVCHAPAARPAASHHLLAPCIAVMTLLLLEALGALVLLVFIVWWTMFSGRKKGELPDAVEQEKRQAVQDGQSPTPKD
jgi:hypothetical protein